MSTGSFEKAKEFAARDPVSEKPTGVELEMDSGQYDLLDDCRMMFRFAVKEGLEPDQSLRAEIAALDALLVNAGLKTISETPAKLFAANPPRHARVTERPEIIR